MAHPQFFNRRYESILPFKESHARAQENSLFAPYKVKRGPMEFSRRKFLYAAGSVAAVSAVPQAVHSLQGKVHGPRKIRIGYAAITWADNLQGAMEDISSVGYRGIQLRANAVKLIPNPPVVKSDLAQRHLEFTALSSGDIALDPAQEKDNLALHADHAKYLSNAGGLYLQVLGTFRANGQFTEDEYSRTGKLLTEVGKRAADYGVQVALHNHMGSIAQSPEQLAKVLDAADPRYVKLLLDVAHYKQGGGDPTVAIKKYADRLLFLHLKDVKPADTKNGYEFCELGEGTVNLHAVVEALHAIHYQGWLIVEFDSEPRGSTRTPKESAELSKHYIENTLGLQV
jgi:inosose dehydratase